MGELLEAYGGTSCALAPDDGEPDVEAAMLAHMALCSGARSALSILRKRAPVEFPPVIPVLDVMLHDVEKAERHRGRLPEPPAKDGNSEPADVVRIAFCTGVRAAVQKLYDRAPTEFPAVIPALDALRQEVKEIRHYRGSLWELNGGPRRTLN
jgi:hypothetical protein